MHEAKTCQTRKHIATTILTNKPTSKTSIRSLFQLSSLRCQMKYILIMELGSIHLGSLFNVAEQL